MSCNFRDFTELIILFKVSTIGKNVAKAINRFFEHRINLPPPKLVPRILLKLS
jgi:hypothetical protein